MAVGRMRILGFFRKKEKEKRGGWERKKDLFVLFSKGEKAGGGWD